jgi:hypothetical protein
VAELTRPLRVNRIETFLNPNQLPRDYWLRAHAPLKGSSRTQGEASESRGPRELTPQALSSWGVFVGSLNHRFDKLGNPLPMELHGCGCSLCARRNRALLEFWEAR